MMVNGVWRNPKPVSEEDRVKWRPYPMDRGGLKVKEEVLEVDRFSKKDPFDLAKCYAEQVADDELDDNPHLYPILDLDRNSLLSGDWCPDFFGVLSQVERNNLRDLGECGNLTLTEWESIKTAWGNRCAYCREIPNPEVLEHVVPICLGGRTTKENVVLSCSACNSFKGSKTIDKWLNPKRSSVFKLEHERAISDVVLLLSLTQV